MAANRFYDEENDILSDGDDELMDTIVKGLEDPDSMPYSKEFIDWLKGKDNGAGRSDQAPYNGTLTPGDRRRIIEYRCRCGRPIRFLAKHPARVSAIFHSLRKGHWRLYKA